MVAMLLYIYGCQGNICVHILPFPHPSCLVFPVFVRIAFHWLKSKILLCKLLPKKSYFVQQCGIISSNSLVFFQMFRINLFAFQR